MREGKKRIMEREAKSLGGREKEERCVNGGRKERRKVEASERRQCHRTYIMRPLSTITHTRRDIDARCSFGFARTRDSLLVRRQGMEINAKKNVGRFVSLRTATFAIYRFPSFENIHRIFVG